MYMCTLTLLIDYYPPQVRAQTLALLIGSVYCRRFEQRIIASHRPVALVDVEVDNLARQKSSRNSPLAVSRLINRRGSGAPLVVS